MVSIRLLQLQWLPWLQCYVRIHNWTLVFTSTCTCVAIVVCKAAMVATVSDTWLYISLQLLPLFLQWSEWFRNVWLDPCFSSTCCRCCHRGCHSGKGFRIHDLTHMFPSNYCCCGCKGCDSFGIDDLYHIFIPDCWRCSCNGWLNSCVSINLLPSLLQRLGWFRNTWFNPYVSIKLLPLWLQSLRYFRNAWLNPYVPNRLLPLWLQSLRWFRNAWLNPYVFNRLLPLSLQWLQWFGMYDLNPYVSIKRLPLWPQWSQWFRKTWLSPCFCGCEGWDGFGIHDVTHMMFP